MTDTATTTGVIDGFAPAVDPSVTPPGTSPNPSAGSVPPHFHKLDRIALRDLTDVGNAGIVDALMEADSPSRTNPVLTAHTRRSYSVTTASSLAIDTDSYDFIDITALATDISFTVTGTPTNFRSLVIRIRDNASAHALSWSGSFASRGAVLPTTTIVSKVHTIGLFWNSNLSTWDCVAAVHE